MLFIFLNAFLSEINTRVRATTVKQTLSMATDGGATLFLRGSGSWVTSMEALQASILNAKFPLIHTHLCLAANLRIGIYNEEMVFNR